MNSSILLQRITVKHHRSLKDHCRTLASSWERVPPVGGTVNVFDWYRDMAKTDKTQFGGISGNTALNGKASPNNSLQNSYTDLSTGYNTLVPTSTLAMAPKSESEVVDLVCELSGLGGNETVEPASHDLGTSELDMNTFLNSIGEDELKMLEFRQNIG